MGYPQRLLSLGVIPRTDGVFSTLLSPEQPLWLLQHATKTISYLASRTYTTYNNRGYSLISRQI